MKCRLTLLMTMAALFAATVSSRADTFSSGTLSTIIPDNNQVGISSTLGASGLTQAVDTISVTLDITGGFNGDLYAYLIGPQGGFTILFNRVGLSSNNSIGYANSGFSSITLQDGYSDIHNYQLGGVNLTGSLTGTWSPDGRNIDPQSTGSAFDSATRSGFSSAFNNTLGNGNWTLFIADLGPASQSTLNSWALTIVTVPEPQTMTMLVGGAIALLAMRRRKN